MPPLVLICTAWVTGLLMAHYCLVPLGVEVVPLAVIGIVPAAAMLLWRADRRTVVSGASCLALLLGSLRYQAALPRLDDPATIAHYNGAGWVTVEGVVTGYPDVRDTRTNLVLSAESIAGERGVFPVHGNLLVPAPRYPPYRYGDRVRASGRLEAPPESEAFSYRDYLAQRGIYSTLRFPRMERLASGQGSPFWTILYGMRDRAEALIGRLLPAPESSLLQGIVLGIKGAIPRDLYDDFNTTGTSHIIVISGANITLVAALFSRSFGQLLGKRRAYWLTMAGIVLYVLLVGADAAPLRAGVMGCLYVTARYLGRLASAHVSLLASAAFLTAINPLSLWDVGFLLSFAATLSLILFSRPLEGLFERMVARFVSQEQARPALRLLNDALVVTLAAQVLATPVILFAFGRLSLVAPLANLLVLPVQPAIMAGGGVATALGLVPLLEPIARVVGWIPWLLLAYTVRVVRWLAGWPLASVEVDETTGAWLTMVLGLALLATWGWRRRRTLLPGTPARSVKWKAGTAALPWLLLAAVLAWWAVVSLPDGRLHVAFLDVGQGDAILITTPRGRQVLVDGGPSPEVLASALGREMPFWDRSIDLLVSTHADADHLSGLAGALERFDVGGWLDNGLEDEGALYGACRALLDGRATPRAAVRSGDRLDLGQGIEIDVLGPPPTVTAKDGSSNDTSVVLHLQWQQVSFLLTGDIETSAETALLRSGRSLHASVLKVAHHGSGGSTSSEFLAAVQPAVAVISVGASNTSGHPAPELLERLELQAGTAIMRTDEQGTIEFATDGRQIWMETER